MTKNWHKYHQKRLDFHFKKELKEWEKFKQKNRILVLDEQKSEFLHVKYVDLRVMTAKVMSFSGETIYNSQGWSANDNRFKISLRDAFKYSYSKYKKNPINNFVKFDIPSIRKSYKEKYTDTNEWSVTFGNEPEFFNATEETIIDFLAHYNALEEVTKQVREESETKGEIIVKQQEDKEIQKGLSNAQIVLVFGLLNDQNKISKHQDRIRFARFIAELTGRNEKNIKDTVNKYFNDISNGNIHKTEQRNIDDYERVRSLFEMIDNQDIVKVLDKRIDRLKKQMINR